MAHPVYILIFPSPLFPAHWSLFIPSVSPDRTTDNPTQTGTRIHVHGDAKSGFAPEFVRNYDTFASVDGDKLVWLADIEEQYMPIVDGPPSKDNGKHGEECRDIEAGNELERIALTVPAPGPSLTSVGAQPSGKRIEIQNCQTWLRQLVESYVQKGIMGNEALSVIDSAPKN